MPIRNYSCECGNEYKRLLQHSDSHEQPCPKCGKVNEALLPTTVGARVYETKDKRRGKKLMKNQDRIMKKRMHDHHDRYELAEKIDKHGMDDARKFGWTKKLKKV